MYQRSHHASDAVHASYQAYENRHSLHRYDMGDDYQSST